MIRTLTWTDPRLRIGLLVLLALAVLPVAWYLGSPLFLNQTVNEALPSAPAAQVGQASTGAAALRSGQFNAIDGLHKGEGTAAIYRQPDGRFVVRLDPFQVTNGPDLYVYLSGYPAPTDSAQLHQAGAVEVARLKATSAVRTTSCPRTSTSASSGRSSSTASNST
jgi:hypothetical protein